MLYRDNEILIFDEPTAVLTPQEIQELMEIMKNLAAEGKMYSFYHDISLARSCRWQTDAVYSEKENISER